MQFLLAPASRLWLRLRLNEVGPLLSLAGFGFFAWAFIAIADEVREGETHSLDSFFSSPCATLRISPTRSVRAGLRRRLAISPVLAATPC